MADDTVTIVIPNIQKMPHLSGWDSFPHTVRVRDSRTKNDYAFWIEGPMDIPIFALYSFSERKRLYTWEIDNSHEAKYIYNRFLQLNKSFFPVK